MQVLISRARRNVLCKCRRRVFTHMAAMMMVVSVLRATVAYRMRCSDESIAGLMRVMSAAIIAARTRQSVRLNTALYTSVASLCSVLHNSAHMVHCAALAENQLSPVSSTACKKSEAQNFTHRHVCEVATLWVATCYYTNLTPNTVVAYFV